MHPRAKYQKAYQLAHHDKIKETKRNHANASRRLETLLVIKDALLVVKDTLEPVNRILGQIKKPKENDTH